MSLLVLNEPWAPQTNFPYQATIKTDYNINSQQKKRSFIFDNISPKNQCAFIDNYERSLENSPKIYAIVEKQSLFAWTQLTEDGQNFDCITCNNFQNRVTSFSKPKYQTWLSNDPSSTSPSKPLVKMQLKRDMKNHKIFATVFSEEFEMVYDNSGYDLLNAWNNQCLSQGEVYFRNEHRIVTNKNWVFIRQNIMIEQNRFYLEYRCGDSMFSTNMYRFEITNKLLKEAFRVEKEAEVAVRMVTSNGASKIVLKAVVAPKGFGEAQPIRLSKHHNFQVINHNNNENDNKEEEEDVYNPNSVIHYPSINSRVSNSHKDSIKKGLGAAVAVAAGAVIYTGVKEAQVESLNVQENSNSNSNSIPLIVGASVGGSVLIIGAVLGTMLWNKNNNKDKTEYVNDITRINNSHNPSFVNNPMFDN
eukprot:Pgem_evm1s19050